MFIRRVQPAPVFWFNWHALSRAAHDDESIAHAHLLLQQLFWKPDLIKSMYALFKRKEMLKYVYDARRVAWRTYA